MHFDEVYHGRSATEFLSSWQEDWDRDVYEWTHPMLAKYLIAGGIAFADPNAVVDSAPLTVPAGKYFLMGDNRSYSADSRAFGPFTRDKLVGRVWLRYWPLNTFTLVHQQ